MPHISSSLRITTRARLAVLSAAVAAATFTVSPIAPPSAHAAHAPEGSAAASPHAPPTELRGTLPGGGRYVLHEPAHWNGTVLVWNPGYGGSPEAAAAPSSTLRGWLLSKGYALAGARQRQEDGESKGLSITSRRSLRWSAPSSANQTL